MIPSEFPEYIDLFPGEIPYRAVRQDELMLEGFREEGTLVPSDRALGPRALQTTPIPPPPGISMILWRGMVLPIMGNASTGNLHPAMRPIEVAATVFGQHRPY
jgi:hypothetical protein